MLFWTVLLGVPVFWLVLKLTNILYEEKALSLGAFVFGLCSVVSVVMFFTNSSPSEYYKPLLILFAGVMSFICVSPIFSESQPFDINNRKKYFSIDGNTFPVAIVNQVNVKRCFNRTSRSCKMEIFISEKGSRARSIYYETNDVAKFREIINWFKKYTKVEFDSTFTKATIDSPSFIVFVMALVFAMFTFCLIIPATMQLNEKRKTKALPEYKLIPIPKQLKDGLKHDSLIVDSFKPVFEKQGLQIVVFDGAHSSHFVGNLRKALYSYPDQSYDYNIVFVSGKGMSLKTALEGKVFLSPGSQYPYTKFVLDNCNKFCLLDNELGVFYRTDLETIDPRINNVQDAINMLTYASDKRTTERKKLQAARQAELDALEEEESY